MTALWTLAELHAAEAREDVRRIVERPYEPFRGRIAEIVLAVLDGDDELIASRLRAHEHDATAWLAYAARLLATPRTRGALEEVATSAPDEGLFWSCASMCASHRQSLHRSCYREHFARSKGCAVRIRVGFLRSEKSPAGDILCAGT